MQPTQTTGTVRTNGETQSLLRYREACERFAAGRFSWGEWEDAYRVAIKAGVPLNDCDAVELETGAVVRDVA